MLGVMLCVCPRRHISLGGEGSVLLSSLYCVVMFLVFDCSDKHEMMDEDKMLVTSNLESALTLYCKSRSISYDRDAGWTHILRILVALKYSKAELYNCFYAVTTRYIPRFVASIFSAYVVINLRRSTAQWLRY